MPILLVLLVVIVFWMWLTFKARQRTKSCRWRENHDKDTPDGRYFVCMNCGVEYFAPDNLPPAICLKPNGTGKSS